MPVETREQRLWVGPVPAECQVCEQSLQDQFIDGRVAKGPWGILCPACHALHGCGFGLGRGQLYVRVTGKEFIKAKG